MLMRKLDAADVEITFKGGAHGTRHRAGVVILRFAPLWRWETARFIIHNYGGGGADASKVMHLRAVVGEMSVFVEGPGHRFGPYAATEIRCEYPPGKQCWIAKDAEEGPSGVTVSLENGQPNIMTFSVQTA